MDFSVRNTRHVWVLVHRYAGLAMAGFLILVGLTGSLLAFLSELEHWISPQLHAPIVDAPRLDGATLAERVQARLDSKAQVDGILMSAEDFVSVRVSPLDDPVTGEPFELDFDQLILDPFTGQELGRRSWGAISQGLDNLMPFIYQLHYELALDTVGIWILGIVALVWTLDCFVGFYLTLPAGKKRNSGARKHRSFWQRWQVAWRIKWSGSPTRINFDLHRAGGLWLWLVLLIFAWSSVYMNLWDTVYAKVTDFFLELHEPWTDLSERENPLQNPKLSWREAQETGARLMERAATQTGFSVERQTILNLRRELGMYVYGVRSSADFTDHGGGTRVFFDADSGTQRLLVLPSGQYSGNTVTAWLGALHMANVFGLPYRIFVCVLGLVIVLLSVTGILIWLRKRRSVRLKATLRDSAEARFRRPTLGRPLEESAE